MLEFLTYALQDYTLRTVILGSSILGLFSGLLGSFAVLRKQSLLGDAISHAALPGIGIAFLLTLEKDPLILLLGAIASGWIGTLFIMGIIRQSIVKEDAALGMILSVFFGVGIVLLTFIQDLPTSEKAGLESFLFGSAATLLQEDVIIMAVLGGICLLGVLLFWKEFKLLSFDPSFGQSLGFPMRWVDIILTTLIVVAIVIGLQTVGVVLMSAMIIAPAVAARQWTDRLHVMVILAAVFGMVAGVSGAVLSSQVRNLSTGPVIVVMISIIVMLSLAFAPRRGMLWEYRQYQVNRKRIDIMRLMHRFYRLAQSHRDPHHPHDVESLRVLNPINLRRTLREIERLDWAEPNRRGEWKLTKRGLDEAKRIAGLYGGEV